MTQKQNSHRFIGRQIERTQFLDFVKKNKNGYFCIFGHPGIGKSSLVAEFIKDIRLENELRNTEIIVSWIRRGTAQAQIEYFLNDLIKKTDDLFPHAKEIKSEGKTILNIQQQLFSKWRIWSEQNKDKKLLIFIDGLDEGTENNLVSYLPRQLFDNIIFIFSSRPGSDTQIEELWASLPRENFVKIELGGLTENNIREILDEVAQGYNLKVEDSWFRKVVNASQGNPLYLKLMCDSIDNGFIKVNESNVLPNELNDYYKTLLQRYAKNIHGDDLLRCMYSLAAAYDFLTIRHLGLINNLDDETLKHLNVLIKEFCYESILDEGVIGYQLFHESLREYLLKWESANLIKANKQIIHFCSTWKNQMGEWEQRYSLENYGRHLSVSSQKVHQIDLFSLFQNKDYTDSQKKVLRHFEATKNLYQLSLERSSELYDYHLQLESALNLVELKSEETAEAPFVLTLVTHNEIDLALKRIESFANNDEEGLKRKFKLYMLCLIELTLLDTKNKPFQKEALEKLLNHLDEHLPMNYKLLNWSDFFPINLFFKMAGQWVALDLDYKIILKRGYFNEQEIEICLEREAPFSDNELEVLENICSKNFLINQLIKQNKLDVALEHAKFLSIDYGMFINVYDEYKEYKIYEMCTTFSEISIELGKQGKEEKALALIHEALTIANKINDFGIKRDSMKGIFTSIGCLGRIEEAIEIARTLNYDFDICFALITIIRNIDTQKVDIEKLNILNEAYNYAKRISEEMQKNIAYREIGIEFARNGRVDEALDIAKTINELYSKSYILEFVASELSKQGRTSEAISLLHEALNIIYKLLDNELSNKHQENNYDDYDSFDDDDSDRFWSLKDVLGEDYNEIPFPEWKVEYKELLKKIYSQMVCLGKGYDVYKFILGVGDIIYKIEALLHLSTEENKVNTERNSEIFICIDDAISELEKYIGYDEQYNIEILKTLALIEQDRLEMAKVHMNEALNFSIIDDRGDNTSWYCFDDFIPALEKKGKLDIASEWVKSITMTRTETNFNYIITMKLIKQLIKHGQIDEAFAIANDTTDEDVKAERLAAISSELYIVNLLDEAKQTMQKALELSLNILNNDLIKSEVIQAICSELSFQSKWQDIIDLMLESIISVRDSINEKRENLLTDISIELANKGKLNEAFKLSKEIKYANNVLAKICIEFSKQGNLEAVLDTISEFRCEYYNWFPPSFADILIEFVNQNRLQAALQCVNLISDKLDNNDLEKICFELLKQNLFEAAIQLVVIMKDGNEEFFQLEDSKTRTLLEISSKMAIQGHIIKEFEIELGMFESSPHTIIDSRTILRYTLQYARKINSSRTMLYVVNQLTEQGFIEDVDSILNEARDLAYAFSRCLELKDISHTLFIQGKIAEASSILDDVLTLIQKDFNNYIFHFKECKDIITELTTQGQIIKAKKLMQDILSYVMVFIRIETSKDWIDEEEIEIKLSDIEEIFPQIINLSMIKEAFLFIKELNDYCDYFSPLNINCLFKEIFKQNKVEEAFQICATFEDLTIKNDLHTYFLFKEVENGKYEEALHFAKHLNNQIEKDYFLKIISLKTARQGNTLKAIECSNDISNINDKNVVLEVISIEMTKQGMFEEALKCVQNINCDNTKNSTLHQIALELFNQKKYHLTEKAGLSISNLSKRRNVWEIIANQIIKESNPQFFLQIMLQFQHEEIREILLKTLIEDINILKVDHDFIQNCLKHIVHDSDTIEKLLKKYAIRSIFLTDISDEQIHRLNKSLGIQWAIDIYNRLN
jgi:hypothetical protein